MAQVLFDDNIPLQYAFSLLTTTGITVPTRNEILADLTANYKTIYGIDTNTDLATADQAILQIWTQISLDIILVIQYFFVNLDVNKAQGSALEMLCALNNVTRAGATKTIQQISVTTNKSVTLNGSTTSTPYTIRDSIGNKYVPTNTTVVPSGTSVAQFESLADGAITSALNTITIQVNVLAGVIAVNNPTAPTSIGQAEDSDTQLRLKRAQQTQASSRGFFASIIGAVRGVTGVTSVYAENNNTGVTSANGTAAHTDWFIENGGLAEDIGNAIANTLPPGCGLRGTQTYSVPVLGSAPFVARWDNPAPLNLFIRFSIQPLTKGASFNVTSISQYIVDNLKPDINQTITSTDIVKVGEDAVAASGGIGDVEDAQLSVDGGTTWLNNAVPPSIQNQFVLSTSNIIISSLNYPPTT